MTLHSMLHVQTDRHGVVNRRGFLRNIAAGAAGLSLFGWKDAVTLHAEEMRKKGMACVLLYMRGGPSQFETFDPKPGHENGGPTKAIKTSVPGIEIAEGWENVAKHMKDIALIRSMTSKEGEHQRASFQMHTGYIPTGGVKFPAMGSIVASELAPESFDLPHFVSIGSRLQFAGSGFLGMRYAPFVVSDPSRLPSNTELPGGVDAKRLDRRMNLLEELEKDFAAAGGKARVEEHQAIYKSAADMVLSPRLKAFDIGQEKNETKSRYGDSAFGRGCLLARRLVEAGVTFVEVELNGWDTHDDNFERSKKLSSTCDAGFAALLGDLKERGMLDKTLVIWMGEFGRTPRINGRTGRDHYPRAFSVALAGGGIKGGQVIGKTSDSGADVKEKPVKVNDLFCTFYRSLKIDPHKENISNNGRPIKLIDGGTAVKELV